MAFEDEVIRIFVIEINVLPATGIDFNFLRHARHEQQRGQRYADPDCHCEIDQHGQAKGEQQHDPIANANTQ